LLAGVRHPFSSPNNALGVGIMPQNFTYSIQLSFKTFLHAYNAPNVCAVAFAKKPEIACKMGHFVSQEQFNVWHTQRVGYGQFVSTKISVIY
jgi:hypothetical protein